MTKYPQYYDGKPYTVVIDPYIDGYHKIRIYKGKRNIFSSPIFSWEYPQYYDFETMVRKAFEQLQSEFDKQEQRQMRINEFMNLGDISRFGGKD